MGFAQTLGATVTHVVPRGAPDPTFPRDAAHGWATWRRKRDDRMFASAREATGHKSFYEQIRDVEEGVKREHLRRKDWLDRQRQIARGWARWMRWRTLDPHAADAYRQQHQDADSGDWAWLIGFASTAIPRSARRQKAAQTKTEE
jgi:hypothetical protein